MCIEELGKKENTFIYVSKLNLQKKDTTYIYIYRKTRNVVEPTEETTVISNDYADFCLASNLGVIF